MNTLIALIDSSTKRSSPTSKYGSSTTAWAVWWNVINGLPVRAEVCYIKYEGPNKAFYDGVIRILNSCYHLCHNGDILKIFGDCKPVIAHIKAVTNRSGGQLIPFYNQVKALENKYRCQIEYHYLPKEDPVYKKIDNIAKQARGLIESKFTPSK